MDLKSIKLFVLRLSLLQRILVLVLFISLILVTLVLPTVTHKKNREQLLETLPALQTQDFPLQRNEDGRFVLRCIAGKTVYETRHLSDSVDVAGLVECYYTASSFVYVPLSFYDHSSQELYYWSLMPIKNPEATDNLEKRAELRIASALFEIKPSMNSNILENQHFVISYGELTEQNLLLFNPKQIFKKLSFDKVANSAEVNDFLNTGISNKSKILVPLSVDRGYYSN